MSALDDLLPEPRRAELDAVDVAAPPAAAWQAARHSDLGRSRIVRTLFDLRTLPERRSGRTTQQISLRIDDIDGLEGPGFHILAEDPGHEVALGAIGKVWEPNIPFLDVADGQRFAAWSEPGWVKVAWALRVTPRGDGSRVSLELRVDATDDDSWRRFRRYFRVVGPVSRFIRHTVLSRLGRELGVPEAGEVAAAIGDVAAAVSGSRRKDPARA